MIDVLKSSNPIDQNRRKDEKECGSEFPKIKDEGINMQLNFLIYTVVIL